MVALPPQAVPSRAAKTPLPRRPAERRRARRDRRGGAGVNEGIRNTSVGAEARGDTLMLAPFAPERDPTLDKIVRIPYISPVVLFRSRMIWNN
jgi:hypothetical protein